MEDISLKRALKTFKKRLVTIILITLTVFGLGCAYTFLIKVPLYRSTASVILVDKSTQDTESLELGKSLSLSYAEIMKSRKLTSVMVDELGLDREPSQVMKNITVAASEDTGVVSVTVTDEDPELAAEMADKMIEIFQDEIDKSFDYTTMSIVDTAEVAATPFNMSYVKDMIIYFVVGLVLALGVVFLVFYS